MDTNKIKLYDLKADAIVEEQVPGETLLKLLYHNDTFTSITLRRLLCHNSFVSRLFASLTKSRFSKGTIEKFIKKYNIELDEFEDVKYGSFNDFFIRKLKQGYRQISDDPVILPCDGRHLFYQDASKVKGIYVKGQVLSLPDLIQDINLASLYRNGIMFISRLAPVDYHRFHFPVDGVLKKVINIPGSLHSVSPLALKQRLKNLIENKKMLLKIESQKYGNVLMIPIGATNVGSIHITAEENKSYKKGDELGYFSFGGSMVITLFQKDAFTFDEKLTTQTENQREVLLKMGTSLSHCE